MSSQTAPLNKPSGSIGRKMRLTLLVVAIIPMFILAAALAFNMFLTETIMAAVILQFVGLLAGFKVVSGVVRQTATINETLVSINNGNLEARASNVTNDELSVAADAINAFCDNSLNMTQSNDDHDQIQASIENLIAEMKEIAAGDLTISTAVNEDMTGSIAASVNQMTEQLRSIVRRVQSAAEEVNSSAARIRDASTTATKENVSQADRISEASRQLLDMTDSFQNVAESTQESVQVAIEARQTASNGLKAVSDTVDGMQRIRNQVQSTSKRIKRLGESSQEIGEIVQMISDIADRTSILALNASIQAAMAGDAGQGFAVVAEEIECLAERSTDATKEISKLIRAIQSETSEVISDMEESTREVVSGSQLANQAGETLFEIDSVSNQLVELIQETASSALEHADQATEIASSMSEISVTTKESAESSREATRSVDRLAVMVNQLRNSVSQFKVSADSDLAENKLEALTEVDELSEVEEPSACLTTMTTAGSIIEPVKIKQTRVEIGTVSFDDKNEDGGDNNGRVSKNKKNKDKKFKKSSSKQNRSNDDNRKVTRTVMIDEKKLDSGPADGLTEGEIDDNLLRQVREATVYLDEVGDTDNDSRKNSRGAGTEGIRLDDI